MEHSLAGNFTGCFHRVFFFPQFSSSAMEELATLMGCVVSAVMSSAKGMQEQQLTRIKAALKNLLNETLMCELEAGSEEGHGCLGASTAPCEGERKVAPKQGATNQGTTKQDSRKRTRLMLQDLARERQRNADREVASFGVEEAIERANAQGATETEIDVEGLTEAAWMASTLCKKLAEEGIVATYYPRGQYGYDMTGSPRVRCAGLHVKWV